MLCRLACIVAYVTVFTNRTSENMNGKTKLHFRMLSKIILHMTISYGRLNVNGAISFKLKKLGNEQQYGDLPAAVFIKLEHIAEISLPG